MAKNHLIALFSSTHPDFPDDLWDRFLPHTETLSTFSTHDALILPSLPDRAFTAFPTTLPPTHFIPLANSALLSPIPTIVSLGTLTGTALSFMVPPLPAIAVTAPTLPPFALNTPLPYFHFAASDLHPLLLTDPTSSRPSNTLDGTDLIGWVFNDPDLSLCRVVEVGPLHRLAPGKGNLDPIDSQFQADWVPTLRYTAPARWAHLHLLNH